MSSTTVSQFAETVGTPVERLIEQMHGANIKVDGADATITDEEKQTLLAYLQNKHGSVEKSSPNKIVLRRKTTSELSTSSNSNKSGNKVKVEVRKKRTYVKKSEVDTNIISADAELLEARRIAQEEKKRQEEILNEEKQAAEALLAKEEAEKIKLEEAEKQKDLDKQQTEEAKVKGVAEQREVEALARKQSKPILKKAPRTTANANAKTKSDK